MSNVRVLLAPHFYAGPRAAPNRWAVPAAAAAEAACYAVSQLLVAMLTNTPPHAECATTEALHAAVRAGRAGYSGVPKSIPFALREIIVPGLAVGRAAPLPATLAKPVAPPARPGGKKGILGAPPPPPPPVVYTLQHLRRGLLRVQDVGAGMVQPTAAMALPPQAVDDYAVAPPSPVVPESPTSSASPLSVAK